MDDQATCMLVEVIAKRSQKRKWNVTVDGRHFSHDRILRVSLDKFYEIVFGEKDGASTPSDNTNVQIEIDK